MPVLPITLIKGDRVSSKTDYRDNLPVNMYAVKRDILGAQGYMLQYSGLTQICTGFGADRGGVYNERQKNHYRVSGGKFISVSPTGAVVDLGDISGTGQATLEGLYGFNTQGIIADGKMWLYNGTTLNEITDVDLGSPLDGVWIDGYYFLTDGEYIYHTDITSETSIDPLKFATAEFMPDPSIGVGKSQDNKAIVFGRYTIEVFENRANPQFAFTRIETRALKIGIVATHAKCQSNDLWYILGGGKDESISAHVIGAGTSSKIATREIDKIIKQYSEPELSNVVLETRTEDDTCFVLFHLPNETLCFNATLFKEYGKEIAWTILKSDTLGDNPYRGINAVFDSRSGKWVCGDHTGTEIGYIDDSISTQYGEKVEWSLYTPLLNLESMSIDEIEIKNIPGHSVTDDAKVAFSITTDGLTYSSESWELYGEPSEYNKRFIIREIGYVENFIGFKFRGISESRMAFGLMKVTYS